MNAYIQRIAYCIYESGGRSRDCAVQDEIKKYGEFAEKILDKLAKIELKHLNKLRKS